MGDTKKVNIRDTDPTLQLNDSELDQIISDAKAFIEIRWQDDIDSANDQTSSDIEEVIQRYLVLHMAEMSQGEEQSSSATDKSITLTRPSGDINEWLRNTSFGRTVAETLSAIGISPSQPQRSTPKTYR